MRRRSVAVLAVLSALCLGATSCGIPLSGTPHLLSRAALPQPLVQHPSTPGGSGQSGREIPITIYLVNIETGGLVARPRNVPQPVTVQSVLDALESGPEDTDYNAGYGTALATESHLVAVGGVTRQGVATVRLDQYYTSLQGELPVEEIGQIVWSVTESLLSVKKVYFVGPDGPVAVETGKNDFVQHPVGRCDYQLGVTC